LSPQGVPVDTNQLGRIQTLFTDLTPRDVTDEVYMVARVLTNTTIQVPSGPVSGVGVNGHSYYTLPSSNSNSPNPTGNSPILSSSPTGMKAGRKSVLFS